VLRLGKERLLDMPMGRAIHDEERGPPRRPTLPAHSSCRCCACIASGRHRRIRRVTTPLGFKVVQATNAYEVHEPKRGLGWLAAVLFAGKATGSNYPPASAHVFFKKEAADEDHERGFTPQVRLMPRAS
jgi:hypothetical protein